MTLYGWLGRITSIPTINQGPAQGPYKGSPAKGLPAKRLPGLGARVAPRDDFTFDISGLNTKKRNNTVGISK